jgi:hypothetical protein
MYQDDIHKVASDFLKNLERGHAYNREEQAEPTPISVPVYGELVALKREEAPQYFCGFKPSGRPIFTHELRLAKSYEPQTLELANDLNRLRTLGFVVVPHPTVWLNGKHRSEQF